MDDPLLPIKVKIEHKKEVTQEIPEDVTRARNSAWLDVISPITEWAGMKGDELNHKRSLLRLEREASLFELSQKLKDRLEGKTISQIPTKQLIPALEKASLEQSNSEFIEKWANLLTSAALAPGDDVAICTSILGDLGPAEAALLEKARLSLETSKSWPAFDANAVAKVWNEFMRAKYPELETALADHLEGRAEWDAVSPKLTEIANSSPCVITYYHFAPKAGDKKYFSLQFSDKQKVAIDVLKYRNLLEAETYWETVKFGEPRPRPFRGTLTIGYFRLTDLGLIFLRRVSSHVEASDEKKSSAEGSA